MLADPFDFLEVEDVPSDECCKCAEPEVAVSVQIGDQVYAFCSAHDCRGLFLQRGKSACWPALRIQGTTGTYAIDSDVGAWMLTALCGTDERIVELLDALDAQEELEKAG